MTLLLPAGYTLVPTVWDGDKWTFVTPNGHQSTPHNTKQEAIHAAILNKKAQEEALRRSGLHV